MINNNHKKVGFAANVCHALVTLMTGGIWIVVWVAHHIMVARHNDRVDREQRHAETMRAYGSGHTTQVVHQAIPDGYVLVKECYAEVARSREIMLDALDLLRDNLAMQPNDGVTKRQLRKVEHLIEILDK
ncbi:hypothetical protein [Pseudomonas virus PBPA162]|uniref:PABS domain-containing protein n=1 Tax=Pseudomonas virus PBPA162 TaxID=2588096 RepID=A0A4Y5TQP5_9CAUD|nr:hypothetical protein PQC32_gp67 [Pseudomonas virus PBPA162]QDB70901.1 hypothetical protein [Pseudomonas virus PBPA162]